MINDFLDNFGKNVLTEYNSKKSSNYIKKIDNSLSRQTDEATYQRCFRLLLLFFLFALLNLLRYFSFGLSYELSEGSAVSYTGDKGVLQG